ncbi:MAG TPA: triose-phosphate isomerase [Ktedonobacteraceae bacterium]|nr:triose-phosphate isomerase [Ktedonobacteraceae bacterium]
MQKKLQRVVVVNFKSTRIGSGHSAVALAKKLDSLKENFSHFQIIVAVQPQDIYRIAQETGLKVFAQHVDPIHYGNYSGSICPDAIKEAGAQGTLLNHPEKKVKEADVSRTMCVCREVGLEVIICASGVAEGAALNRFSPDYIAIECEALIGKPFSLVDVYPQLVDEALLQVDNQVLFGAGIKTNRDVRQVLMKGGSGIMVSSLILNAPDPTEALQTLLHPAPTDA